MFFRCVERRGYKTAPIKNNSRIVLLLLLVPLLSSCMHLKYRPPDAGDDSFAFAKYRNIEGYLDLFEEVELGGIYWNEQSGFRTILFSPEKPSEAQAYLDFFHLSDVQLCEEQADLFGRAETGLLETLVDSLRHGRNQEKYDYAVFMSILLGIDSYVATTAQDKPSFLIHTGDSIHWSLVSELWEFLYIFNQSLKTLPWFNVIGNHDVTILGTPVSRNNVWLKNPTLAFLPVSVNTRGRICDPTNFINFHHPGTVVISGIPILGPLKEGAGLKIFSPERFDPDFTQFQGFDMIPLQFRRMELDEKNLRKHTLYDHDESRGALKGYYCFDLRPNKSGEIDSQLQKVRIIVLNTSEYVSYNAMGGVSDRQVEWVKDILEGLPDSYTRVIAFGHHPLIAGEGNMRTDREHRGRLKSLQRLFEKHVDVYFCGHAHIQSFDNGHGFLQIIGPSLLVFPQSGHKVRIEYGEEDFCVQVVPFSHLEMQYEKTLRQDLDQIAAIWERDGAVIEALKSLTSMWKEESYLKTKDINDIITLWEKDGRVKKLLDEKIKKYKKESEIKRTLKKAVLLKHAYLGRKAAMHDGKETVYSKLGTKYKFILPIKQIKEDGQD